MLRLALIENLRRVSARIAAHRTDRNLAEYWADQMTEIAAKDPKSLILVIADMARSNPPMVSSFVAELDTPAARQGACPGVASHLDRTAAFRVRHDHQTVGRSENQQQAADQISMSNSIGSLRFLGAMDWREFVETMSAVEQTLREDAGGIYAQDGFCYPRPLSPRHRKIAKSGHIRERGGGAAIALALRGSGPGKGDIRGRPCRVLPDRQWISAARTKGEGAVIICRGSAQVGRRFPLLLYGGSILLMAAIFAGGLVVRRMPAACMVGCSAVRHAVGSLRKSSGNGPGELAGDAAGDAALAAANGLLQRDSSGVANPGSGPDNAYQR